MTAGSWLRVLGAAGAALVLAAACARIGEPDPASAPPPSARAPGTAALPSIPATTEAATSLDGVDDVVAAIQLFWQAEFDQVGEGTFEPVPEQRVLAFSGDADDPARRCDGLRLTYDVVFDNALAAPCDEGLLVAYDEALFDELTDRFGPTAPAVVLAHEWGHVVQFQSPGRLEPVIAELQADCYAGSWVAWATDHDLRPFGAPGVLDTVLAAVVDFRDDPGLAAGSVVAHGSGFDRVRAFQQGFVEQPADCAGYAQDPPPVFQFPFSVEELATGGNLPLQQAVELMSADLTRFFSQAVPGMSPPDALEVASAGELTDAHRQVGDNAVGLLLAMGWAEEAQRTAGQATDGDQALLQRVCLAGAWMGELLEPPEDAEIALSPGDLDEAVVTVVEGRGSAGRAESTSAFEIVASLGAGVVDGMPSCGLT
jgi:predicted metalloprotease